MKIRLLIMTLLIMGLSCKEKTSQDNKNINNEIINELSLEDTTVFEHTFLEKNLEDEIAYNNVISQSNGMLFAQNTNLPSYIIMPFSNLNLSRPFNVSFSYNTSSNDGTKPQSFIALVDDHSSPSRDIPLFIYSAGKRITGVYGDQALWAQNYVREEGESRGYYDSYQLNSNEFYFVSINFTGSAINIYVNSELYASFDNIKPHNLKYKSMIIGALPQGNTFVTQFYGIIHGLKIFSRALSEKEIVSVYNNQPYVEMVNE